MTINTEEQKKKLVTELQELETELLSVGRRNPSNLADWEAVPTDPGNDPIDPNEVADNMEDYEGNTAILKQLEIRYNEVKQAIEAIEKGTYGICSVCGKQIEDARLEALPSASTCIAHEK
jgi:RNA polymerase-binding transcription factor DksA